MENSSDIFESKQNNTNNIEITKSLFEEENPFTILSRKQERIRHLNDYDSNILQDGAYKEISDDAFKLEYKISRTEEEIKNLQSQINLARQMNDYNKINELQSKLDSMKSDYQKLLAVYNERALSAKITDSFSNFFGRSITNLQENLAKIFDGIISAFPCKLVSALKIRKSLGLLENINKNVDELITMTIPYGENVNKYQQLSKYIIKANSIRSEISGYINKN